MKKTVQTSYGKATITTEKSHVFPVLRYVGSEHGYNIYVYDVDGANDYYAVVRTEPNLIYCPHCRALAYDSQQRCLQCGYAFYGLEMD